MTSRLIFVLSFALSLCLAAGSTAAQVSPWSPTKSIRMLLAYPPGAANDTNARAVAGRMTETLKQQVIMDNRPGANGIVATTTLARATPDGHTLMAIDVAHAANPALYDKIPYDTLKDFEAISLVARLPMILLVHPAQPFKTVKELVAYAKGNAGKLNYGAAGVGSAMYLAAELFKEAASIDLVQIAYKGGAPALIELAGGQLPMAFISLSAGMPMVQSGRARVLGVSSAQRVAGFADVPTIAESGVPGFEFYLWQAIIGPAGLPRATLTRLNSEINNALTNPEVKERLTQAGNELIGGTPAQAAEFVRADVARWKKIIKPEMRLSR